MPIIPVRDWTPDAAPLGSEGSLQIVNALPGTNSYKPMPSHTALYAALTERPRGAIDVRDRNGSVFQYVGTESALHQASSNAWVDVSKSGGYATGSTERWDMILWKNKVIATNYDDNIQEVTLGAANFADLTTDFRARNLAVVRDWIVAANTFDGIDGAVPDRVRTCQFNNETDWTVSPQLGSIARDLKSGPIIRVFGGEYGVLFTQTDTFRMDFIGAPTWFQINRTLPDVGLIAPRAAARIGDVIYAWSNQGFVAIRAATGFEPIGAGRVDTTAFNDLADEYRDRITAIADPRAGRIFWAYPGSGTDMGRPNRMLCYDKNFNKWSHLELETELLWSAGGVGFTLEQLDAVAASIEDLPASLDSSQWLGDGQPLFGSFDAQNRHGLYDGAPLPATVETTEVEFNDSSRTQLNAYRPLVDGGSFQGQVLSRDQLTEDEVSNALASPTSTGRITQRVNARYHRFRIEVSGDWRDFLGVQIDNADTRPVGHRG